MADPTQDLDDGNIYIFCDDLLVTDGWDRRCVRGAGHNGEHFYSRPPYPQTPVVLAAKATERIATLQATHAETLRQLRTVELWLEGARQLVADRDAQLVQVTAERDDAKGQLELMTERRDHWYKESKAAEQQLQQLTAERAALVKIEPLHGQNCPYKPYEDGGEAPEDIVCTCDSLAARWKSRAMLERMKARAAEQQVQTLRRALVEKVEKLRTRATLKSFFGEGWHAALDAVLSDAGPSQETRE